MMTTIVDHNDIRLQPSKRVTREPNPQVRDGTDSAPVACKRRISVNRPLTVFLLALIGPYSSE